MSVESLKSWLAQGPWPVDGGLGSELTSAGFDLADDLWSARLLRDHPQAIANVHRSYIDAGARIVTTASYQASRRGFAAAGLTHDQADDLIASSVTVARQAAAATGALVAASVGPYGAVLGGGQEYEGNYGLPHRELVDFHAQRLAILAAAGPDMLACETIPDLREVEAILEALAPYTDIPVWLSMSCRDGQTTCAGQPFGDLAGLVRDVPNIVAVGVNCTKPEFVSELLEYLGDDLPAVVYPNAGRVWNGNRHEWEGDGQTCVPAHAVSEWVTRGARLLGGCCGLGPTAIADLAAQLITFRFE